MVFFVDPYYRSRFPGFVKMSGISFVSLHRESRSWNDSFGTKKNIQTELRNITRKNKLKMVISYILVFKT